MKNLVFVFYSLIFLLFLSNPCIAQSEENTRQINAGLGFSNRGVPIYGGVEFGIHPDFTVGGELSFHFGNDNLFRLGALGNYHFNHLLDIDPEWDIYGGAKLGYIFSEHDLSGLHFGIQAGARYFFQKNLGLNFELGGGNITIGAKVGITYRF